ncbi:hypothetical protein PUN28_017358 [Cardiocondyla obscurior]|uniref:Uncharacterized protein n=1 Tax=Cardiocondyla obscurior TaxID=286306 RepID=A0AAW2ESA5_9HYME
MHSGEQRERHQIQNMLTRMRFIRSYSFFFFFFFFFCARQGIPIATGRTEFTYFISLNNQVNNRLGEVSSLRRRARESSAINSIWHHLREITLARIKCQYVYRRAIVELDLCLWA